jgi:Mg/Co/Ni transporter MgtE
MSANAKPQNSANAKSPPEAPSSVSGFSAGNAIGSMLIIGLGIASIVLFIRSTISTSDLIGNTENWRAIKPQIKRIWWQTAVGATILFIGSHFLLNVEVIIGVIVTTALISVIIIASLIGTFIPLLLNKFNIDPALATGPFITTSNDICGILIYFSIAKLILGF